MKYLESGLIEGMDDDFGRYVLFRILFLEEI